MPYFSNDARDLKRALSEFLEQHMFNGLSVPGRKFAADCIYALLKSGSPLASEQARALCEAAKLITTEKRLCLNYSAMDLSPLASNIALFSVRELMDIPYQVDVDESGVIKPHGSAFEELGIIRDGSKEGRPREKGYHVTGVVGYCRNGTVAPLSLTLYSTSMDGYESLSQRDLQRHRESLRAHPGQNAQHRHLRPRIRFPRIPRLARDVRGFLGHQMQIREALGG